MRKSIESLVCRRDRRAHACAHVHLKRGTASKQFLRVRKVRAGATHVAGGGGALCRPQNRKHATNTVYPMGRRVGCARSILTASSPCALPGRIP
ncbi:hypothetical protein EVAR_8142_1 [Eumeta japonica]|uniref:Uncharacterized protein n=1 Tax=Eumeta variegata TaxID=151549 RepID=A0A4C1TTD1_EUMVA|nr:hypothetical protein EVAR_8142_1 [Eumeta japonica]